MAFFLLDRYVNVNIPNFSNFYPLHFAVQGNHVEMVKALLNRGAEMGSRANDYDQNGNSTEVTQVILFVLHPCLNDLPVIKLLMNTDIIVEIQVYILGGLMTK